MRSAQFKTFASLVIATSLLLSACDKKMSSQSVSRSGILAGVDLGQPGNASVAQRFQAYKNKAGGCSASGKNPKALITGFGLFYGVQFNMSGFVVDNMRSPQFFPSKIKLSDTNPRAISNQATGLLQTSDQGGTVVNRTLNIDGRDYDFCFLLVDVQWDLAAAIIVYEMQRFQPNLVIMSGLGDDPSHAIFEGGANNATDHLSGFQSNGSQNLQNTPVKNYVLPAADRGVQPSIAMSWNNQALKAATSDLVQKIGFYIDAPTKARANNDYICNNVSFVAAHAARGVTLHLAGGSVVLSPKMTTPPQVGFMHYPQESKNSADAVYGWSKVIAMMVKTALGSSVSFK